MRQIFPYAGSSGKYAALISEIIRREGYETYAEPMVGSGAVFFDLAPASAYIGDIEWLHANFYEMIRQDPYNVCKVLDTVKPTREWFEQAQKDVYILSDIESAGVWYALLILCYNGVVKFKDELPYLTFGDRYLKWERDLDKHKQRLIVASNILASTEIWWSSYEKVPPADIAFFDPPWFDSGEDYGVDFDHPALATYISEYPGKWLLTINDTEESRELYKPLAKWQMDLEPRYIVAPVAHGRGKRKEMLLASFEPVLFGG